MTEIVIKLKNVNKKFGNFYNFKNNNIKLKGIIINIDTYYSYYRG